jgi:two-component system, LytTR family, response regulator LytT
MADATGVGRVTTPRILIVEDEAPAHRRLIRLLRALPGYSQADIRVAESLRDARQAMDSSRFDAVLLDLELAGRDGFDLVRTLPSANPTRMIVVSAFPQRAIEAFEHAVVDFVRKPVSPTRLAQALARLPQAPPEERAGSLVVRRRGSVEVVPLDRVVCVTAADDYVELTLSDGRRVLHDETLDAMERGHPERFTRVHRSHLVSLAHLVRVSRGEDDSRVAVLAGGAVVPVSRRRSAAVDARLRELNASVGDVERSDRDPS